LYNAAIRAGYSKKTAQWIGPRLVTKSHVAAKIAEGTKRLAAKTELSAERVLLELGRIAFCDVRQFFDKSGKLKPISKLNDDQGAVLAGFSVVTGNISGADGHMDTIHRIKLVDKIEALRMLAQFFGLLKVQVQHEGSVTMLVGAP
jgi:phage terminase small subunit